MNKTLEPEISNPFDPQSLLEWYLDMGIDESIGNDSVDRYAKTQEMQAQKAQNLQKNQSSSKSVAPQRQSPSTPSVQDSATSKPETVSATQELVQTARQQAAKCQSVQALKDAVAAYEGCGLKKTAQNTVFADGNPEADVMVIGEAPGAEEDRQGVPFVGPGGRLLDKMLFSIGLQPEIGDRAQVYLSNIIFWRPPGNRNPTESEMAMCLPFVYRHIELVKPKMILLLGGAAGKSVLQKNEGISRLRGRWFAHKTTGLDQEVVATALFHPDYLLRSPGQKRRAWNDLLALKNKLKTL